MYIYMYSVYGTLMLVVLSCSHRIQRWLAVQCLDLMISTADGNCLLYEREPLLKQNLGTVQYMYMYVYELFAVLHKNR